MKKIKQLTILFLLFYSVCYSQVIEINPVTTSSSPGSTIQIGRARVSVETFDSVDNYAITTDGNNYLSIVDNDSLTFAKNGVDKPFYLSAWVELNKNYTGVFSKASTTKSEYKLLVNSANGTISLYLYDSLLTTYIGRYANTNTYNTRWGVMTHIVATYNGNESVTGVDIYMNGVAVDLYNLTAGSYGGMHNTSNHFKIGYADATYISKGQFTDIRIGNRFLGVASVDSLYNHIPLGDELVWIPCTEGNGRYAKNVANNNIQYAARIIGDVNGVSWDTLQTAWDYNNTYGYTNLIVDGDTLVYPNYPDSTQSFTPLYGDLLWGQSNAYGLAASASLTGDYVNALTENLNYSTYLHKYLSYIMRPMWNEVWTLNSAEYIGVDPLLALKYKNSDSLSFVLKHAIGSSALAVTENVEDWHPQNPFKNELWVDAILEADSGLIDIIHRGKNPFVRSFIWDQGEQDATVQAAANAYQTNLEILYDSVCNRYGDNINMQLVLLGDDYEGDYQSTVRAKQELFYAAHPIAVDTIDTDNATYIESPPVHYDHTTFIRFADVIYDNIKNISLSTNRSWLYKKYDSVVIDNETP